MTVAVVFDSAGTLLRTTRAVKNVAEKNLCESIETTLITFQDPDRILVLLNIHTREIMNGDSEELFSTYLKEIGAEFGISCGRRVIVADTVGEILFNDPVCKTRDMQDVVKSCWQNVSKETDRFAMNVGAIINLRTERIEFTIAAAGYPFHGVRETISKLHEMGVASFIASGDRTEKLELVADHIGIPRDRVHGVATPVTKAQIVTHLEDSYDVVIMCGDGINDLSAMKAADISVLTTQQEGERPNILYETADYVINDISEIIGIVEELIHSSDE